MKQCQKWWNEKQTKKTEEEFLAKYEGLTTQEQVMDAVVEMTWRAALEMVLKEREIRGENHLKCVFDMIEEELGNA